MLGAQAPLASHNAAAGVIAAEVEGEARYVLKELGRLRHCYVVLLHHILHLLCHVYTLQVFSNLRSV